MAKVKVRSQNVTIIKSHLCHVTHVFWTISAMEFDGFIRFAHLRPFLGISSEGLVKNGSILK